MWNSSIWPIDSTLSSATTPEWTWEWWQWRGTPHSPKLLHYWTLTIRLFNVISRTLIWKVLPLCRDAVGVFCSNSWLGHNVLVKIMKSWDIWFGKLPKEKKKSYILYTILYIYIYIYIYIYTHTQKGPHSIMVKELDCDLEVSDFKLQSCYYVHFQTNTLGGKVWTPLSTPPAMG